MTRCPIFLTFEAGRKAALELDQLATDIIERFKREDEKIFKHADKYRWEDDPSDEDVGWVYSTGIMQIATAVTQLGKPGRAKNGCLSIRFELWRQPADEKNWPHASDALLIMGYSTDRNDPWDNEGLAVSAEGRLKYQPFWDDYGANQRLHGRFLSSGDEEGNIWSKRCWVFALALAQIDSSDSLDRFVIHPVVNLLNGKAPNVALAKVPAVKWAST